MSINITLTPVLEKYAQFQVDNGLYGSVSEFIRETIRIHIKQNKDYNMYLENLHKELEKAANEIESGKISKFDMNKIIEETIK